MSPVILSFARLAIGLAALAVVPAFAAPEPADVDFIAAKAAFDRGQRTRFDALAAKLAGHPLESYVDYWELTLRIDAVAVDDVQAFVAKWPDSPLGDRLRVDALKALGKRGDWAAFGALYPPPAGEDTEIACYAIQLRWQREGDAALAAAKPLWFTGQSTPEACEPLFSALITAATLSTADRRARFRLAAESGQRAARPGDRRRTLPRPDRHRRPRFARVDRDPARALAKGEFAWKTRGGRDLALYALERAARSDAAARARRMGKAARAAARSGPPLWQRQDRLPRGAAAPSARQRLVSRSGRRARSTTASMPGECARRCAPARGAMCWRRSRRCRPR